MEPQDPSDTYAPDTVSSLALAFQVGRTKLSYKPVERFDERADSARKLRGAIEQVIERTSAFLLEQGINLEHLEEQGFTPFTGLSPGNLSVLRLVPQQGEPVGMLLVKSIGDEGNLSTEFHPVVRGEVLTSISVQVSIFEFEDFSGVFTVMHFRDEICYYYLSDDEGNPIPTSTPLFPGHLTDIIIGDYGISIDRETAELSNMNTVGLKRLI